MSSYEDELILQTQINYENYFIAEVLPKLLVDYNEDLSAEITEDIAYLDKKNFKFEEIIKLTKDKKELYSFNLRKKIMISGRVIFLLVQLRYLGMVRSEIFMREEILNLHWNFHTLGRRVPDQEFYDNSNQPPDILKVIEENNMTEIEFNPFIIHIVIDDLMNIFFENPVKYKKFLDVIFYTYLCDNSDSFHPYLQYLGRFLTQKRITPELLKHLPKYYIPEELKQNQFIEDFLNPEKWEDEDVCFAGSFWNWYILNPNCTDSFLKENPDLDFSYYYVKAGLLLNPNISNESIIKYLGREYYNFIVDQRNKYYPDL